MIIIDGGKASFPQFFPLASSAMIAWCQTQRLPTDGEFTVPSGLRDGPVGWAFGPPVDKILVSLFIPMPALTVR